MHSADRIWGLLRNPACVGFGAVHQQLEESTHA